MQRYLRREDLLWQRCGEEGRKSLVESANSYPIPVSEFGTLDRDKCEDSLLPNFKVRSSGGSGLPVLRSDHGACAGNLGVNQTSDNPLSSRILAN